MNDMQESDHDILITLVANMKELRIKQADNHKEIKDELTELKNGYATRLEKVEMSKFPSVDFIQFRNSEFAPLTGRVKRLENWQNTIIGGLIVLGIVLGVVEFIINKYVR